MTSYITPVTVTLHVRQWIDVKLALLDAAEWNERNGYPNGAVRLRELAKLVEKETRKPLAEARLRAARKAVSR